VSGARCARWHLAVLLAAGAAAGVARAETQYVIEQLVVLVTSAPDPGSERIATLKSGDRVEVLERVGDTVHVQLASGKDGWIGARYLSSDEPLRPRLAQRDAQLAQLKEEVTRLQGELAAARAPAAAAAPAAGSSIANTANTTNTAIAAPAAAASAADTGGPPAEPLFTGATDEAPPRPWPWVLSAALAGLLLGFAVGALVLDRYIRRKYGGLRIY
jgi:Bacterial SH3 domain